MLKGLHIGDGQNLIVEDTNKGTSKDNLSKYNNNCK